MNHTHRTPGPPLPASHSRLCLSVREGEHVAIYHTPGQPPIRVKIRDQEGTRVGLTLEAPRSMRIHRVHFKHSILHTNTGQTPDHDRDPTTAQ